MKTSKKGRPVNPNSKRQQKLSLVTIIEESKKRGRPKGSFKIKKQEINVDELIQRIDQKIKEIQEIQKEINITLKYFSIIKK